MASVLEYVAGTPFIIRIRSSLTENRRVRWHNTFEIRATENGDNFVLSGAASAFVAFITAITYSYVTVDEITVSTWTEDSHPYNPLGFFTEVYNQAGLIPLGVKAPVALRQTLFLKKVAQSGLPGKIFIRGALSNEDLVAVDGEWGLNDIGSVGSDVAAAVISSGMENHMNGMLSDQWGLFLIGNDGESRLVIAINTIGTSDVKLNHKYFDRAP